MKIKVKPFPCPKADQSQLVKIAEETMEAYSAWEDWREGDNTYTMMRLLDELADIIQATCNLIAAIGHDRDFQVIMDSCTERNERRGRYDITEDAER